MVYASSQTVKVRASLLHARPTAGRTRMSVSHEMGVRAAHASRRRSARHAPPNWATRRSRGSRRLARRHALVRASGPHIVALLAVGTRSTMAQTGVSGPVVVDGESFLDALFASAGQG